MAAADPIVRMTGICKRFPGVQALQDAELEVAPGEVHVLLGENGAGKSTLMKILCGQYAQDRGSIVLDGTEVRPASPSDAERLGLIMIHQELNLVPGLPVADNIYLGHEPTRAGLLQGKRIRAGSRELLDRLGSGADPAARVDSLSVAEQQLVEIARALRERARVLVMDEPTAALSDAEIAALFEVIRSLCADGRRGDLHLAPAAGDLRHRRSRHRDAGRPHRRRPTGRDSRSGRADPADGRS